MRILYCGPFISAKALKEKRAVNQAAAKWSRELLSALSKTAEADVISHCPEQRWPAGRVFWQDNDAKWFNDFLPCERIAYPNIVGLKDSYLSMSYRRAARRLLRKKKYDAFICYNTLHPYHVAAMEEARKAGVKCVPIILDGDDPRKDNWGWIKRTTRAADGIVFLSWWMKENCPVAVSKHHMDGGADGWKGGDSLEFRVESVGVGERRVGLEVRGQALGVSLELRKRAGEKWLVHTGALDKWRGLGFMAEVIRACRRNDVRFIFCGKCDKVAMRHLLGDDPRVDVRGFVSDEELTDICRSADAFLNVRDPDEGDNILNYPSKVPQYLAWGKPVVSTWIDSFSPDYRNVLDVCDNTPEGFVRALDDVLARSSEENLARFHTIKDWFEKNKSWDVQAGRLIEFAQSL